MFLDTGQTSFLQTRQQQGFHPPADDGGGLAARMSELIFPNSPACRDGCPNRSRSLAELVPGRLRLCLHNRGRLGLQNGELYIVLGDEPEKGPAQRGVNHQRYQPAIAAPWIFRKVVVSCFRLVADVIQIHGRLSVNFRQACQITLRLA
jgi:hypothetical protein